MADLYAGYNTKDVHVVGHPKMKRMVLTRAEGWVEVDMPLTTGDFYEFLKQEWEDDAPVSP